MYSSLKTVYEKNITAGKLAEESLLSLLKAVNTSSDAIFLTNTEGIISYVNAGFTSLYGYTADEVVGKLTPRIVKSGLLEKEVYEDFWKTLKSKREVKGEILNKRKNGETLFIDGTASPILDEQKKIIGFLGIQRDITERKQAELLIQQQNQELQELIATKNKIFSIISHDLRSPFVSFLCMTEILAKELSDMTPDQIQEIVDDIRTSAINMFRLLENLLQWTMMQQGLIAYNPELVQLLPVVNESLSLVIELAKNKRIDITYDIPDGIEVFADTIILQSLIRNLLSNAVKFTHKGGKIHFSAITTDDKNVVITIRDSGIGMNRNIADNLFRFGAQTSRKGTDGEPSTGLGLLICQDFIEKHGGSIWVESKEGNGSTFYFSLPLPEKEKRNIGKKSVS
jgi:PAS domain S-box-containing protein